MDKIPEELWSDVDWDKSNAAIARELGISQPTVSKKRYQLGVPPHSNTKLQVYPVAKEYLLDLAKSAEAPPDAPTRPLPILRQVVLALDAKGWSVPQIARWIKLNSAQETRNEIKVRRYVSGVLYKTSRKA